MTFPLNDSLRNNTEEAHIPFFLLVCFLFQVFSSLLIVSTRQISSIISAGNINRAPRNGFSVFPTINYALKLFLIIIFPRTIWTDSVLGHIFIIKFLHRPLGLSHSTLINIILFPLFPPSPKVVKATTTVQNKDPIKHLLVLSPSSTINVQYFFIVTQPLLILVLSCCCSKHGIRKWFIRAKPNSIAGGMSCHEFSSSNSSVALSGWD